MSNTATSHCCYMRKQQTITTDTNTSVGLKPLSCKGIGNKDNGMLTYNKYIKQNMKKQKVNDRENKC